MKRTFLTARTFGLMAVLATVVGTAVQPTVQAQAQEGTEANTKVQTAAQVEAERACLAAYPPEQVFPDGTAFFMDDQGITLSAEQMKEVDRFGAIATEAYDRIQTSGIRVLDPDSTVGYVPKVGTLEDMPPEIERPILERMAVLEATTMDAIKRAAVLNEEFGQYAEFGPGSKVIYTPEQVAALRETQQYVEDQYFAMLTPEQQQQLQKNKVIGARINEACGIPENDMATTLYGFDPEFVPTVF